MSEQEQRVLSVSYGSFSVKLEGFDDPFAIMRRVTEYFRSVASLDPSFGLKPLTEDLAVFEALETAVFDDDISIETEGSTLTLTPRGMETPQDAPAERDVFVLDEDAMTQEPVIQAPLQTEPAQMPEESTIEESAEQQTAAAATPLDLRDMAHNHQEMPFIGAKATKPRSASVAAPAPAPAAVVASEEAIQETEVASLAEDVAEAPMIDFDTETLTEEEFFAEPLELPEAVQAPQMVEEPIETPEAEAQEAEIAAVEPTEQAVPKFRTLTLSDFEEAQPEPIEAPLVMDAPEAPESEVSEVEPNDAAISLQDQEPVKKRSLRIIRNTYTYEEPEELEPAPKAPEEPKIAVNPFRKFPKRDTDTAPVAQANLEVPEVAKEQDGHDDLIRAYRKIKAEHG